MYILIGFIAGFLIPFMARRLGKILPATTGVILSYLPHIPRFPHVHNPIQTRLFHKKWRQLCLSALASALATGSLFILAHFTLPAAIFNYAALFIWIMLFAASVDIRFFILPDCLTIPLLFCGFLFAIQTPLITPNQSIYGALFAYGVTVIATLITSRMQNNLFGGGDSKMLIALGAWLGIEGISYTFFISFFLFVIYNFFMKSRTGAYGPALSLASLLCFFLLYAK